MAFDLFQRIRNRGAPKSEGQSSDDPKEAKRSDYVSRRLIPLWGWSSGDYSLTNNESIFAAVTRISNTFASVKFHLYRNREIQRGHPLENLVSGEPNMALTPYGFQQTMEAYRSTTGNAYAFKVPTQGGGIDRLDILDPEKVEPMINEDTGELWYRLNTPDGGLYVHGREMIHTRYICTNGYKGISPVRVLFNTLDYDEKIKRFSLTQLETGIHSSIALEIPSEISKDKKTDIIATFLDNYKKSGGALIVLDAGAKATRLPGSIVDAKVFEVEKITRNRVATVYNIPPHMLGDYSDSSYRTNEQSMLEFLQLTMQPIFTMYAQEYDKKLLTAAARAEGFYFAADVNQLLLADTATRSERNFKAIRSAGMTPNEIRREEGLPDVAGGDELMVSRDLVTLTQLRQSVAMNESLPGWG